jgi:oligopeptide transport system substrate-binding protein
LIEEVGREEEGNFAFVHGLIPTTLVESLRSLQRRRLHRRAAAAIAARRPDDFEALAHHYDQAGQAEKAVEYLLKAGDRARGLYAHQEAIVNYQQALECLREANDLERAAHTLMKLGLTHHNTFAFKASRQAYEEGFILWQRAGEMEPTTPPPPAPHALRLAWPQPLTLDPNLCWDATTAVVILELFSGLVELTPEMDVVPDVARSWEVLDDGRKYVFHLRNDVRWSDGSPVTAGDFEYAWKRVLDPATGARPVTLLYDVQGARAYHQGEVADPDRVGVRALDELTLVVELEQPTGYFLSLLTHQITFPVPRHVVQARGVAWTEPANIVTNGPFRLATWERGESVVLERSPTYHGRVAGNLQQVELSFLLEQPARVLQMYEDNGLDVLFLVFFPPTEQNRARQQHAGEFILRPILWTNYIGFDATRPPFDDARVRRAFTLATDREMLTGVVLRGHHFPATGGLVPPGMPGHSAEIGLPYDPEGARQLLGEAGYPGGRGFPVLDALTAAWVTGDATSLFGPVTEYLQAQWRENLGIEITWRRIERGRVFDRLSGETAHLWSVGGWLADYPDPDSFLRASEWRVLTAWQNEDYDKPIEKARRVMDQEERMRMYRQADRVLVEEAPVLPLFYGRLHLLIKPWVRKYPTSSMTAGFWKDVVIEPH